MELTTSITRVSPVRASIVGPGNWSEKVSLGMGGLVHSFHLLTIYKNHVSLDAIGR